MLEPISGKENMLENTVITSGFCPVHDEGAAFLSLDVIQLTTSVSASRVLIPLIP